MANSLDNLFRVGNCGERREGSALSRREILRAGAVCGVTALSRPLMMWGQQGRVFDVAKYGAVGDGKTLDGLAIQRAIDEAAAYKGKAQVLVRGGKKYLVGTVVLKGGIDFHLADDAELVVSLRPEDYLGGLTGRRVGIRWLRRWVR